MKSALQIECNIIIIIKLRSFDVAMCAMALLFNSARLGRRTPIILVAVLVICVSWTWLDMDCMLKKLLEEYSRMC